MGGRDESDDMEAGDAAVTVTAARTCRSPADYALFRTIGARCVRLARGMDAGQRAAFVALVEQHVDNAAQAARMGVATQQPELFSRPVKPDLGFDDDD